jgi:hypothetical protein
MKKIMFLLMLVFGINNVFGQSGRVPEEGGGGPGVCPPGCTVVVGYTVTFLNFHKPRTDCKSGFGLCIKGYISNHCICFPFKPVTSIEAGNVKGVGKIENGKFYLYIPYALKELDEYKNENTNLFTLGEENSELVTADGKILARLVPGDYETKVEDGNFVIRIDLK